MKSSKVLGIMSVVLMMALGACTKNSKPSESEESKDPESSEPTSSESSEEEGGYLIKEPTTITLLNTLSYQTEIEAVIEEFKEIEPNVTVVSQKISGSYDALKTQTISDFQTGEYADLVLCYPDHVVDYITNLKAVQLDDYMANPTYGFTDEELADFVPSFFAEGQSYPLEGTFSVPWCKSTEGMYYNADVLIGLVLPNVNNGNAISEDYINNLTWDELFDVLCPALVAYNNSLPEGEKIINTVTVKDKDGKEKVLSGAVIGYDAVDNLFITLAEQYGYGYTSVNQETGEASILWNNPQMKELVKKFNDAYKKGYFLTKSTNSNEYINTLFTKRGTLFSVGSTGGVKYQFDANNPMKVGVAPIPQADHDDPKTISQGPSLCILDHGNNQEGMNRKLASWLFYKQLVTPFNCMAWATATGYSPVRASVYSTEEYLDYATVKPNYGEQSLDRLTALNASYSMSILDTIFVNPAFKGSSTSRDQVGALLTAIMTEESLTDEKIGELFTTAYNKVLLDMNS